MGSFIRDYSCMSSFHYWSQLIKPERCDVTCCSGVLQPLSLTGICYFPAALNQTIPFVRGLAIKQNSLGGTLRLPKLLGHLSQHDPVLLLAERSRYCTRREAVEAADRHRLGACAEGLAAVRVELSTEWWHSRGPWGQGTLQGRIRHVVCVCFLSSAFGLWLHLLSFYV